MIRYNGELKRISRVLRSNMTESERLLWSKLRCKQLKSRQFYRQKIIGNYVVDFYCPSASLIVEIDGNQHYTDSGKEADYTRDTFMFDLGLEVLRFSSVEVLQNVDGVVSEILGRL